MVMVFCKNLFIGELYRHLRIYGHDFQKIFWIMGIRFVNLSECMGDAFTI